MLRHALIPLILGCALATACGGGGGGIPPLEGPPEVVSVNPTGGVGLPGQTAQFAAVTSGTVTSYAWQFTGNVAPLSSSEMKPFLRLLRSGSGTGSLAVSGPNGTSAPFPFDFSILEPHKPSWQAADAGLETGQLRAGVFGDRIVIAYLEKTTPGAFAPIHVALSAVSHPTQPSDWQNYQLQAQSRGLTFRSRMVSVGGRPAFLFSNYTPPQLELALGSVPIPQTEGDWEICSPPNPLGGANPLGSGQFEHLIQTSTGLPGLIANLPYGTAGLEKVSYVYGTAEPVTDPANWKWVVLDTPFGEVSSSCQAAELDGGISIVHPVTNTNPVFRWEHADTLTPTASSEFRVIMDGPTPFGSLDQMTFGSFVDLGDRAALLYSISGANTNRTDFRMAVRPYPLVHPGDEEFTYASYPAESNLDAGELGIPWGGRILGRSTINGTLTLFRAVVPSPSDPADFQFQTVLANRDLTDATDLLQLGNGTVAVVVGTRSDVDVLPLQIWYADGPW